MAAHDYDVPGHRLDHLVQHNIIEEFVFPTQQL